MASFPTPEPLTDSEAEILGAIFERMFPADELGPGATEIGALAYVQRALAGAYAEQVPRYQAGLDRIDAVARREHEAGFAALTETQQDELIGSLERAELAELEVAPTERFFNTLWQHLREGLFCDPVHGGNRNMLGWRLIGFPGAQYGYRAEEQQLDYVITREPRSLADLARPNESEVP